MNHRDPYRDHVLRIAGIDPSDPHGTHAGAVDPQAWRWGNPEQPPIVPAPAPAYPPPAPYYAQQRPPACCDWTTVAFAAGLVGLFGFLLGSRRA